jgi:hypothetical protein
MRGSFFHNSLATADIFHLGAPVSSVGLYHVQRTQNIAVTGPLSTALHS